MNSKRKGNQAGMNPDRYHVYAHCRLPGGRTAFLQKAVSPDEPLPWCAYIGANGHYFKTEPEMLDYLRKRKCRNLYMQPGTATPMR